MELDGRDSAKCKKNQRLEDIDRINKFFNDNKTKT